jgi:hypothetical protein
MMQRLERSNRLIATMLGAAAAGSLLSSSPALASGAPTQFGAYLGAGCTGRDKMPAFESFVGRKVERTVDALNATSWKEMRSSIAWLARCWKDSGLDLTLSVPMLPRDKSGTLQRGVAGEYDDIFREVATALVDNGHADAIVRIGWEFNGGWMPWRAAADPKAYIAYYRRIVGIMRAVEGQKFKFEWCPNVGKHEIAPDQAYPGDDVVDVIGLDIYNEIWSPTLRDPGVRFRWFLNQPYGLRWHQNFAKARGKPISFPEWGSGPNSNGHGAPDDPVFITSMAQWFARTRPLYQSYFEYRAPNYDYTLAGNTKSPNAAKAYKRAFGKPG